MTEESKEQIAKEQKPRAKRARKPKSPEQKVREQKRALLRKLEKRRVDLWERLRADFLLLEEQEESNDDYKIVTLVRFSNELKELSEIWLEKSNLEKEKK